MKYFRRDRLLPGASASVSGVKFVKLGCRCSNQANASFSFSYLVGWARGSVADLFELVLVLGYIFVKKIIALSL